MTEQKEVKVLESNGLMDGQEKTNDKNADGEMRQAQETEMNGELYVNKENPSVTAELEELEQIYEWVGEDGYPRDPGGPAKEDSIGDSSVLMLEPTFSRDSDKEMTEGEKSKEDESKSMTVQPVDQVTHWQEQENGVNTLTWQSQERERQMETFRAAWRRYQSAMAASLARYQSTMEQRWSDYETDDEQDHAYRHEPGYWKSVD